MLLHCSSDTVPYFFFSTNWYRKACWVFRVKIRYYENFLSRKKRKSLESRRSRTRRTSSTSSWAPTGGPADARFLDYLHSVVRQGSTFKYIGPKTILPPSPLRMMFSLPGYINIYSCCNLLAFSVYFTRLSSFLPYHSSSFFHSYSFTFCPCSFTLFHVLYIFPQMTWCIPPGGGIFLNS